MRVHVHMYVHACACLCVRVCVCVCAVVLLDLGILANTSSPRLKWTNSIEGEKMKLYMPCHII